MCAKKVSGQQQPEALATLAAAAKSTAKPKKVGLTATAETAPVKTDPKKKQDAAAKVLKEGATGKSAGAKAAVKALPDRTKAASKAKATPMKAAARTMKTEAKTAKPKAAPAKMTKKAGASKPRATKATS